MTIPDFLPFLRKGVGDTPADGGCLMQVAGFLYDVHSWRDDVACVHPVLRRAGIAVNDGVADADRRRLSLAAARIAGSADAVADWSDEQRHVLDVRLAAWCARSVLGQVRTQDRQVAEAAIRAAEAWADCPCGKHADAAYAAHAAWAANAADAAAYAADAAAYAADAAAKAAADAAHAAYAAVAAAAARAADTADPVDWYFALIDEYDRLVGRTSEPLTPEQGEAVRALSEAMRPVLIPDPEPR